MKGEKMKRTLNILFAFILLLGSPGLRVLSASTILLLLCPISIVIRSVQRRDSIYL